MGEDEIAVAGRFEHQRANFEFIVAQMQDRVIQFTRQLQRPEEQRQLSPYPQRTLAEAQMAL